MTQKLQKLSFVCAVAAMVALNVFVAPSSSSAQCSVTAEADYSNSCENDYFTSINATGTGISSTIGISGIVGCSVTDTTYYTTQGITAPEGASITLNLKRYTTDYTAYVTLWVDWTNSGTFTTGDLCGTRVTMDTTDTIATYPFTVPTSGVTTGTRLHMRLMMSEETTGAPCTANYGQSYEFYFIVGSGCTPPVITFTPGSHDSLCAGEAGISITASGAGTGGAYTWAPSTGLSATTGSTVIANPTTSTVYSVTGVISATCSATYLDTVTLIPPTYLRDSIYAASPLKVCAGDTISLIGTSNPSYAYQWFDGASALTFGTSADYAVTYSGTYKLVVEAYGCFDTSATISATVLAALVPVITTDEKTLHTASYYTAYQWYNGATPITGATTDSLVMTSNGNYTVKVTDSNGCTGTSSVYDFSRLGFNNVIASNIKIFPNPATDIINIVSPVAVNAVITTMQGTVVVTNNNAQAIDIKSLPSGVYFIEIYGAQGNRITVQKIVKY